MRWPKPVSADHPDNLARGEALLLHALSGRSGHVQLLQAEEGNQALAFARPVLTDSALLLTPDLPKAERYAAVAHGAAHWLYSTPNQSTGAMKPMGLAVISSLEDARVEHLLVQRFPGTRHWFLNALRASSAEGLGLEDLLARLSRALWDEEWVDPNPWVGKARERVAQAVAQFGWGDAAVFRRLASVLANELGQMRVRMEPNHRQPIAYRDDHSWLWLHEATSAQASTVETSNASEGSSSGAAETSPQLATPSIHWYPEWDYRIKHLKPAWAAVHEYANVAFPLPGAGARTSSLLNENSSRPLKRQMDGSSLDLDSCVRLRVDRAMGAAPDGRVFERPHARPQPFALLVLLDLSSSMNAELPQGGSLLALAQSASLSVLRVARSMGGRAAIHGFNSNTRQAVRYECLLDFDTPTGETSRLHSAQAQHSTRLGSALRHATKRLDARAEHHRLLLVLTDGAPSDVDVFEPRYLVEDARHAVMKAHRAGIHTMCLAGGGEDRPAIARIFGHQAHATQALHRMPRQLQGMLLRALQ
ncbi:nitric oxide reductase activation protein NorD [Ottowia thiooxydans]|uniref:Nitric oxide reductase NorD protein n=1 Tax=Ottowia thiooxydans TaxID=219182 RepID=A0ABV2QBY5_9BURK